MAVNPSAAVTAQLPGPGPQQASQGSAAAAAAARAERAAFRRWFAGHARPSDLGMSVAQLVLVGAAHSARAMHALCADDAWVAAGPGRAAACDADDARSGLQRFAYSLRRLQFLSVPFALSYKDYGPLLLFWGLVVTAAAALLCGGTAAGARTWAHLRLPLLLFTRLGLEWGILAGALLAQPAHLAVTGAMSLSADARRLGFFALVMRALVVAQARACAHVQLRQQ